MGECVVSGEEFHAGCLYELSDLLQGVGFLVVDFLVFAVEDLPAVFFRNEEREVVFVDVLLLVKIVVPDKTGVLPVLRYGLFAQYLSVFVESVQVKYENALRVQVVVDQTEYLQEVFLFCRITALKKSAI